MRVWGTYPLCHVTGRNQVEFHHSLGRGELFGITKKDDPRREWMSSVINSAPLSPDVHRGPVRDSVEMRRLFLRLALERAYEAVGQGEYELTEIDRQFVELAEKWLSENPC